MITGAQIRQGRELLGWQQAELATKAKVETHFVESAESSDTYPLCYRIFGRNQGGS
jgi:ribosome-binding protein aMBF1 (putative translation factor)